MYDCVGTSSNEYYREPLTPCLKALPPDRIQIVRSPSATKLGWKYADFYMCLDCPRKSAVIDREFLTLRIDMVAHSKTELSGWRLVDWSRTRGTVIKHWQQQHELVTGLTAIIHSKTTY